MALLDIRLDDDPILRKKAAKIKKPGAQSVKTLIDDMAETMYKASGIGLAAPQVGISKRLIVVDIGEGLLAVVNPTLQKLHDNEVNGIEACLSLPDVVGEVMRKERVEVHGWDRSGKEIWLEAEGLRARVFQHEVDHLDGVLFTDRATRVFDRSELEEEDEETEEVAKTSELGSQVSFS